MFHLYGADLDINPTEENVEGLDQAIQDLDTSINLGKSGGYWTRIRKRLLDNSASDDVKEAVKEWRFVRMWRDLPGTCELCDHQPIVYHFQIENKINDRRLVVGSECIYNYLEIEGVPDREVLKKRLNALRARAKAVGQGAVDPAAIAKLEEVQAYERKLNILIGRIAAPDPDVDIRELHRTMEEPRNVGYTLGLQSSGFMTLTQATHALYRFEQFLKGKVAKRSTKYKPYSLLPAVQAIMRFRASDEDKLGLLKSLEDLIAEAFKMGTAKDLVEALWSEVKNGRMEVYNDAIKEAEELKAECQRTYSSELDMVRNYEYLHRAIQAGIDSNKDQISARLAEFKKYLDSEDFPKGFRQAKPTFVSYLSTGEDPIEDAAFYIVQFLKVGFRAYEMTRGMAKKWGLSNVRDTAGIQKAVIKAANEGFIDVEHQGDPWGEFFRKMWADDAEIIDLIQTEVDDVKAVVGQERLRVYQVMAKQLDIDVEKFYKSSPQDNDFLNGFCKSIYAQWLRGMKSLSFKQKAVVDRQLSRGFHEAPNSMWDLLKSEISAFYVPTYGR